MFKSIAYDKLLDLRKLPDAYRAEIEAVCEFNSSEHHNMLLEYDSKNEARNACAALKKYAERARMPIVARIKDFVFVVIERKEKEHGNE